MNSSRDTLKIPFIVFGLVVMVLFLVQIYSGSKAQDTVSSKEEMSPIPKVTVIKPIGYVPSPITDESRKGEVAFKELNCAACHSIHNAGGDLAPMLDAIGSRRTEQYLMAHLSNSLEAQTEYKRILGNEYANALPHTRYSPGMAKRLVAYLLTLPEPPGGFVISPHLVKEIEDTPPVSKEFHALSETVSSEEGGKLYDRFGCVACHSIGKMGGWFGPRLDGVGGRHSRSYIVAHITDAQAHAKELRTDMDVNPSQMPRFNITPDQVEKITDFLMTIPELK